MNKLIVDIPLKDIEAIEIHLGLLRETISQVAAVAKAKRPGRKIYIINGGMWNARGKATPHLKVDGTRVSIDPTPDWWDAFGYAWDTGPDIILETSATALKRTRNFISCTCLIGPWGPVAKPGYDAAQGGIRGRSGLGLKPGYLCMLASQDGTTGARSPEQLRDDMAAHGCTSFVMGDGGGSAQAWFDGATIRGDGRKCHNYIVVYVKSGETEVPPKEEEKPVSKYTVCLDPGHGPDTVNGSPDGTYKEKEFAWDMYERISRLLEAHGVHTIVTRTEDTKPSLTERANVANKANATCFISIHSNAIGDGSWNATQGLLTITSSGPMTAPRNILATDLVNAFHAAGVTMHSNPLTHNIELTVLAKTNMPAVLIEYGFHTNKEDVARLKDGSYRDRLAEATAKGVCTWLGVAWETPTEPSNDYKAMTQQRFNFADSTMAYLAAYEYADAMFERLATTN